MSILATKPIERLQSEQLRTWRRRSDRVLGPSQLIMLGVGAIIGTGIFVLTGQAAAANAGPAIVLSMVLAGLTSVLAALCYSEFAATVPVAGSAYTYAYATLGEFVAWIIGWDLILEYALGAATVAVGWSGNFVTLLASWDGRSRLPSARRRGRSCSSRAADPATAVFNLPAVLITVAVTALLDRRRQRIGDRQRGHRRHQGRRRAHRHRRGRAVHRAGELAPVHPREHRAVRRVRLERRAARRRRHLLRLHRLRRRVDVGAGGAEPAARHAARDPRIARDLHGALRAGLGRDGRPGALQQMLNQPAPLVVAIEAAAGRAAGTRWDAR